MKRETIDEIARQIRERKVLTKADRRAVRERREAEKQHRREIYLSGFEPCPFCGIKDGLRYTWNGNAMDWIRCEKCDATGPAADGETEAIAKWNSRPTPSGESQPNEGTEK